MQFKFLFAAALAALAFAAPGDIPYDYVIKGMTHVDDKLSKLNNAIVNFSGSFLGAKSIFKETASTINAVRIATKPPPKPATHLPSEELQEQAFDAADKLEAQLTSFLDQVIKARSRLGIFAFLVRPPALKLIKEAKSAAKAFSNVHVDNTLPDKKERAKKIASRIDDDFNKCIAAYQ